MMTFIAFIGAAVAEITGCFAFWYWLKLNKSAMWLVLGTVSLWLFAYLLTLVESEFAGRAYATYGTVYIFASILWMWVIEGNTPDRFDIIGTFVCAIGALIIFFGPRG
ncbi:YnfA family protein [Candidatus Paracaedibacter symbiosus]|uniref:YnfA family protein n=1 Tax=Candidatus Paracaedibacter symbiosus TaxID=244582 RepID=UPI000509455E|nr:YnfA family protein [Candidatus Paracaedibacter symbiosus]